MSKRTGKRTMWDWTALAGYDDTDIIGICLTQRQVMILKAGLIPAYWATRWLNFPGSVAARDSLDAMIAAIDNQLDGNDCPVCNMEFRDNPADPCEVQYSNDAGETWITMFRKDVCPIANFTMVTDIQNAKTEIENNYTTWDNDIINIAPAWEYEDEQSDVALCWLLDFYIEWVCETAIATIKSNNAQIEDDVALWDDVLEQFAAGLIAALVFINVEAGAAAAVAWAVIEIATELYVILQTASYYQFEDEDAKEAVKCAMYNHIRGETPQWFDWTTSLDDFVPVGAAETSISATTALFNTSEDIYINYLFTLEDINSVAESLPPCPCPQEYIINQLYGDEGQFFGRKFTRETLLAFSNPGDDPAQCPGVWDGETELYEGQESTIGGVGANIRVALPSNAIVVEIRVKWRAYRKSESSEGDKNAAIWVGEPYDDGVYVGGHSWGVQQDAWQVITTHVLDEGGLTATPRTHVYLHNSIDRPNGEVQFWWIYIRCIPYVP